MGDVTEVGSDRAAALIDDLSAQQKVLARAQARQVGLMLEFDDLRQRLDKRAIADRVAAGGLSAGQRWEPGEFAAMEIGLAVRASRHVVSRTMGVARRLQAEAPDAWDAWQAGAIDEPKAVRISRALPRLTRDSSKKWLNALVVDIAVCRTAELLGRWLNEFVAQAEPDQQNERMHRSLTDRYVSVRPDLDGVSFLSASMSSFDAEAVDQVLSALAAAAGPDDSRTLQQRRADALVDILLGRTSNGCHVTWQDDDDDDIDDDGECCGDSDLGDSVGRGAEVPDAEGPSRDESAGCHPNGAGPEVDPNDTDAESANDASANDASANDASANDASANDASADQGEVAAAGTDSPATASTADRSWEEDDWNRPASAFRPDQNGSRPSQPVPAASPFGGPSESGLYGRYRPGSFRVTPCPGDGQRQAAAVSIGVVVSVQSLFGYTDTPGQLSDRSAVVPAGLIRDLAHQPGTLFHRLLTDEKGNLLDVTELGRFPSGRLGTAIDYRDGGCSNPICPAPARRCDADHIVPYPDGPTSADNLDDKCRPDHRAKTLAGHRTSRTGPHTGEWTTPTGHTYLTQDEALPVEEWPVDDQPGYA